MKLVINAAFLAPGGGLTVLLGLLEGWRDIGADLDVHVFVRRPSAIALLEQAGWGQIVRAVPAGNKAQAALWQHTRLPRELRELRADVFFNNNTYAGGAPCPELVHHGNLWTLFSRSLVPYLRRGLATLVNALGARRALARADANVYISGYMRQRAEEIDPASADRNHVIHNGISADFLVEPTPPGPRSQGRLCAVQAPLPHKDNDSLLQAFAALIARMPSVDWKLDIGGGGAWDRWIAMAGRLGIAERVRFLGHLDTGAVKELYAGSSCLLYPSYFEGFGLPVVEAMALGCPVIAADACAIPEVAGDAALLVPPRSPMEIRDAVLRLHQDDALRRDLIERGRRRARAFRWTESAAGYLEIIERLARQGSRRP